MSLLLYSERAGARAGYKGVVKRCRLLIFYEIKTPIVFDRFKTVVSPKLKIIFQKISVSPIFIIQQRIKYVHR
jgi:hypothetical protein